MSDEHDELEGAEGGDVAQTVRQLAHDANSTLNGVADAVGLTPIVEKHPYESVAAAFGAGFVISGGLFSPTTRRLLGMGVKLLALPPVRDKLLDVAEAALDGMLEKSKNSK